MTLELTPIGIIHSPHKNLEGMPIQPPGATGADGTIEMYEPFREGLKDLDGFSHIILLYHFHRSPGAKLSVTPFMDTQPRGIFSTRAPRRPNPIGLSIVQLMRIDDGILSVRGLDILDGTPLLDIKPYVPDFDPVGPIRTGWLEDARKSVDQRRSDDRFV